MHVHTDENKRNEFTKLAWEWKSAPLKAKEGARSAAQVVAKIDKKFPLAKNWTKWWKKRAHLIIESDMTNAKFEDFMKTFPTTNNNLEAFHATFGFAVPSSRLPMFLAVSMTYHFASNCKLHAESILDGSRKKKRKRGSQHSRSKLPRDLRADEWVERPPEKARALKKKG
jgi:hypothetical protein